MSLYSNRIKNGSLLNRLSQNLSTEPKDWLTSVFYSICLIVFMLMNTGFNLSSFEGRIISRATIENYDINFRVQLYFLSIFVFLSSVLLFKVLAARVVNSILDSERQIINYTSLAGIIFFFFGAITVKATNMPIQLVLVAHGMMLIKILIRSTLKKNNITTGIVDHDIFIFSILSSISIFLFLRQIISLTGNSFFINFYFCIFISGTIIYIFLWNFLLKQGSLSAEKNSIVY